jgi:glycosyltransferase involved in cell wall biosynthesis
LEHQTELKKSLLAPVALFAYNRPENLARTLDALARNELATATELVIFCDGAKPNSLENTLKNIENVRELAFLETKKHRFANVVLRLQDSNLGLATAIISGVTELCKSHGRVIVLEDDLTTSPYFLRFMNDSLDLYAQESKVLSIGACNYFANKNTFPETFFTPVPDCWGWATWEDRWQLFEPDSKKLLQALEDKNLLEAFNLEGAYDFRRMLIGHIEGRVSSWAVRWFAVSLLNDKLNLYPNPSLTHHIAGKGATHAIENVTPPMAQRPILVESIPLEIRSDVYQGLRKAYRWQQSLANKILVKLKSWF